MKKIITNDMFEKDVVLNKKSIKKKYMEKIEMIYLLFIFLKK